VSGFPGRLGLRIAAAIVGTLWGTWIAAAPIDVVRDCAEHAAPGISGIKALTAACPQLADALAALGFTRMQYDGSQDRLTRDALRDLASLAQTYAGPKPGKSPDVAALPGILETLAGERTPLTKTWWDAVRAWLAQHSDALNRLGGWLQRIGQSATLLHAISYSLVALVLMATIFVIVNEVKANGVRRRVPHRTAARGTSLSDGSQDSAPLEPAALADKLAALLRELVSRLVQTRRLDRERSLTHRELVARSAFDNESQRTVFASVAGAAESILYGPRGATLKDLDTALSGGRTLLAQISHPPSAH
jgi:Domain of unknown function (DUF4129)